MTGWIDRFYPASCRIEFAKIDLETAVRELSHWSRKVSRDNSVAQEKITPLPAGSLEDHLALLLPIVVPTASKVLLLSTASDWLAFVGNGRHGINGVYPQGVLADALGLETAEFTMVTRPALPSFQFGWSARGPHSGPVRTVAAHFESRWEWHEYGDPLPFEELDAYGDRLKRNRLDPDRLKRYAAALGIRLDDPQFYTGPAALYSLRTHAHDRDFCDRFGKDAFAEGQQAWLKSLGH